MCYLPSYLFLTLKPLVSRLHSYPEYTLLHQGLKFLFRWFHSPNYRLLRSDFSRNISTESNEGFVLGAEAVSRTLEDYESSKPGSWQHDLWESRGRILKLVHNDLHDLSAALTMGIMRGLGNQERRLIVIPFDRHSWLWNQSTVLVE